MLHKLYFSDFIDEDTDDTFEAPLDIPSANELKVSEYDFNDIGNGKWIEDEFGLDVKKFRDVFDDWYDKNIELLNEFELKNHHIPKKSSYIPRSKRYNGLVVMDRTARLYHQLQKKKT